MNIVAASRTTKEKVYGALMLLLGAFGWFAIAAVVSFMLTADDAQTQAMFWVYASYAGLFVVYRFLAPLFYRAYSYGHMIRLSPQQFPQLHAMVAEGASGSASRPRRRRSCTTPTACSTPSPRARSAAVMST